MDHELVGKVVDPGVNTAWEVTVPRDSLVEVVIAGEAVDTSVSTVEDEVSGATAVSVETELPLKVVDSPVKTVWEVVCLPCVEIGLLADVVDVSVCAVVSEVSVGTVVSVETVLVGWVVDS